MLGCILFKYIESKNLFRLLKKEKKEEELFMDDRNLSSISQWVTVEADIKDPSVEKPEFKGSLFKT